jgi:hypothetical protein
MLGSGRGFSSLLRVRLAALCGLSLLLLLSGAWREAGGDNLDPRKVAKIKNGVTTKHEILLLFGEPQEIVRTPEGPIFKYLGYLDAPPPKTGKDGRQPGGEASSSAFFLDEQHQMKPVPRKTQAKHIKSRLTVTFKPDGQTVLSHEYEEVGGKP